MDTPTRKRVAVIGSGAAGVGAAHYLARHHEVTLFERDARLGGHVNTVVIPSGPDEGTPVDTGFIVFNTRTYPRLIAFLEELGVASREGDMSFAYECMVTGVTYGGHNLDTLFARRRLLFHPDYLRLVLDMVRFHREGTREVLGGGDPTETLGAFTRRHRLSSTFVRHFLLPMGAAIWSTPTAKMLDYPAQAYLRFMHNHGLLSFRDRPLWKTVQGGSHSYIRAFQARFPGTIRASTPVLGVRREEGGVQLRTAEGTEPFEAVVLACHADQALRILEDPSPEERRLLGSWTYEANVATLHTCPSLMPARRKLWSSWNFLRHPGPGDKVAVTYWMNRLQGLTTAHDYFVSLNCRDRVPRERVIAEFLYEHPTYTPAAVASQAALAEAGAARSTWFCGSYRGNGFHEAAFSSGAEVARRLGAEVPDPRP